MLMDVLLDVFVHIESAKFEVYGDAYDWKLMDVYKDALELLNWSLIIFNFI